MTDHDRELDEQAARLARPLRQSERLPDDFEARLMARVRAEARAAGTGAPVELRAARPLYAPPPAWRRATRWAFEARPVAVSPARVALLAAGLVAAAVLGGRLLERGTGAERRELVADTGAPSAEASGVTPRDTVRLVQFVLVAPGARSVALVGDFNDWAAGSTPLHVVGASGTWVAEVSLPAGRYQYAFIVDGERWVIDPKAPRAVEESFGTPNSVVTVGERSS